MMKVNVIIFKDFNRINKQLHTKSSLYLIKLNNNFTLDLDECSLQLHNCSSNSQCINTMGSFSCICKSGYTGVNCTGKMPSAGTSFREFLITKCFVSFVDINECSLSIDNCHEKATCFNTEGSFLCKCKPGYEGDGTSCSGRH